MGKKLSFKSSVLDNVPKSKEICDRSLSNSNLSDEIVKRAARETERMHYDNIAEINRQRGHFHEKILGKRNNLRKNSGVRVFHPTGGDVFRYLTNEYLDTTEIEQEASEDNSSITTEQFFFRFYRAVFNNQVMGKGSYGVSAALLGVLRRFPTDVIKKAYSYTNGISPASNTDHHKFRDDKSFDQEIAKQNYGIYDRFGKSGRFDLEEVANLLPASARKYLAKKTDTIIKLEQTDKNGEEYIYDVLNLIGPWNIDPLSADEIPRQSFSFHRIWAFFSSALNPIDDRDNEFRRIKTLITKETGQMIIENQSVRYETMENNNLHSPLVGSIGLPNWMPIDTASETLIDSIKNEQLDQAWAFQSGQVDELRIQIDGREFEADVNLSGFDYPLQIPVETRIVSVYGRVLNLGRVFWLPLGTLVVDFTNIKEGEIWESESKLPNKFHLKMKLVPDLSEENELVSLKLSVNYHQNYECEHQGMFQNHCLYYLNKSKCILKNLTSPEPLPNHVDVYFTGMENLGIFKSRNIILKVLQNITFLSILFILLSLSLRKIFHFVGWSNMKLVIVIVSSLSLVVSLSYVLLSVLYRKGLNSIIGLCMNSCFFAGIVVLGSFYYLTNNINSNKNFNKSLTNKIAEAPKSNENISSSTASLDRKILALISSSFEQASPFSDKSTKALALVSPITPNDNNGKLAGPDKTKTEKFSFQAVNPQKLKSGAKVKGFLVVKDIVDDKNKAAQASTAVNTIDENKMKSLSATIVSISKEADNDSTVLVRFRLDKLQYDNGQEINLGKGYDTIIAMNTRNVDQTIQLNVAEITSPKPNK